MENNKAAKNSSSGETELNALLRSMKPELCPGNYVFCCVPEGRYGDFQDLLPIASFREKEGLTLVLEKDKADGANLTYSSIFSAITLTVHSSLDAVGLTAAVATQLTDCGISANVIAAYYHDHVFVPVEKAGAALSALEKLADSF